MKRILIVCITMIFACAMSMSAQDRQGRRGGNPEQRYEQMKKELGLEDAQVDSLKAIDTQFRAEFQKAREQNGGNGGFNPEEMQKMNEKRNERVKTILTDEQYTKYLELQQSQRRGGPGGGQRPPRQN